MSRLIKAEVSGFWNEEVVGTDEAVNKRLAEIKKMQLERIPEHLRRGYASHHRNGNRDTFIDSEQLEHIALKVTIKEISPSNDYF